MARNKPNQDADVPSPSSGADARTSSSERSELADGVLVQVCVECGKEYFYDDEQPPEEQRCERCGNTVFRSFFAVTEDDEVVADYQESTHRDVTPEEPATEVTRGDLYDLNNP